MDIDVNRLMVKTKIYEVSGLCFKGVIPSQMIADKLSVISVNKVFRRIKDLVDLYYLSHVCDFNSEDVLSMLKNNGKELGKFDGFLNRTKDLKHSYEKFRFAGGVSKPTFEEVYLAVKTFIVDVLPQ